MDDSQDPRLKRYHPDALPSHRRCPACPSGESGVHLLDEAHFYLRRTPFPWNLSRFTTLCREHHRAESNATYHAAPATKNQQTSARRRVVQGNTKTAGILYRPEAIEREAVARQEAKDRRDTLALGQRRVRRLRGPYDPATDGVKLLIQARMKMYLERARDRALAAVEAEAAEAAENRGSHRDRQGPRETVDYHEALEALRTKHRNEGNRDE